MSIFLKRLIFATLILACVYSVLTTIARFAAVVPLTEAATYFSTNFEEEVLYPIWRFAHGGPIYTDSASVPFDQNWYNWIFFVIHGYFARFWFALGIADEWLPTISRLLSSSIILVLGFIAWHLVGGLNRFIRITASILSAAHPYYLFWPFYARPDFMALTFEAAAAFFYISFMSLQRRAYFYGALILSYCAWSAKHSFIQAALAICLHLLVSRKIRLLIIFAGGLSLLVAATLVIGGEHYRQAILFSQLSSTMGLQRSLVLLVRCVSRMPHIIMGLAMATALVGYAIKSRKVDEPDFFLALLLGLSFGLVLVSGGKSGADTNYYIPPAFYACIFISRRVAASLHSRPLAAALFAVLMASPLAYAWSTWPGIYRTRSLWQEEAASVRELKSIIPAEKHPLYVISQYGSHYLNAGNLPWVNPSTPHFVLSYSYPDERQQGRKFQNDGLGGMISQGMIATIVSASNKNYHAIDGADLSHYQDREVRGSWRIYRLDPDKHSLPR